MLAAQLPDLNQELEQLGEEYEVRMYSRQPRAGSIDASQLGARIRKFALRAQLQQAWIRLLHSLPTRK
jgi:hypothetical protein